jgi:hypothetical protein
MNSATLAKRLLKLYLNLASDALTHDGLPRYWTTWSSHIPQRQQNGASETNHKCRQQNDGK